MIDTYQIGLHYIQIEYHNQIVKKHQLNDIGKAIRCLINHSIESEKYESLFQITKHTSETAIIDTPIDAMIALYIKSSMLYKAKIIGSRCTDQEIKRMVS